MERPSREAACQAFSAISSAIAIGTAEKQG